MTSTRQTNPPLQHPYDPAQSPDSGGTAVGDSLQHGAESSQQFSNSPEAFPLLAPTAPLSPLQADMFLHPLNTKNEHAPVMASPQQATPVSANLRIQTDHLAEQFRRQNTYDQTQAADPSNQDVVYNAGLPVRNSSIRSVHKARAHRTDSLSPGSAISSPGIGPLVEMTPLPSPITAWGSPKMWTTSTEEGFGEQQRHPPVTEEPMYDVPEVTPFNRTPSKKRKIPFVSRAIGPDSQIYDAKAAAHARQRSLSDYIPEGMEVPKPRNVVVSTSVAPQIGQSISPPDDHMHREEYLAIQRGIAIRKPPTPPPSNVSPEDGTESQSASAESRDPSTGHVYEARTIKRGSLMKWRALRRLGKGTFSTVVLASSQGTDDSLSTQLSQSSLDESRHDPATLVAIKICEHGPAGGADEQKIEVSIKRELDLMKAINHPSLVHFKAVNMLSKQTIIVENYCAGGDLFELASQKIHILRPSLIRRIFSELVAAVLYLHREYIVHRDIKLENVLVNIPPGKLSTVTDWQKYPWPVVTLTDLGLGRWIPKPPESPMLQTRCGSEDYAAPEVLLGQEYDGRYTDGWALGVLLYAMMEGRLPFDPIPGSKRKSPKSHKIARCEWQWVRWADADGEWDAVKGHELDGAKEVVEALVAKRRSRMDLEKVGELPWVQEGIDVEGGLRRPYELDDED